MKRTRFRIACYKNCKSGSAIELLGCSIEEFKTYLEGLFQADMSWDNYGKYWEVDHIIPLSRVDLTNVDVLKLVCHYTNLQPLTKLENIKKGNKIPTYQGDQIVLTDCVASGVSNGV
jgi:hypothetical protein